MARVTVEDCTVKVPNRFDLVRVAARRVRQLQAGMETKYRNTSNKHQVVALREIADGTVGIDILTNNPVVDESAMIDCAYNDGGEEIVHDLEMTNVSSMDVIDEIDIDSTENIDYSSESSDDDATDAGGDDEPHFDA